MLAALALASLILVSLNLAMNAITRGVSKTRDSLGTQSALTAATGIFAQDVARIAKIRRGEKGEQGYLFRGQRAADDLSALGARGADARADSISCGCA